MTKIKDVAQALRECANSEETKGGMYLLAKTSTSEHVEQWMTERLARAAIEAMRVPTEAMKQSWHRLEPYWDRSTAPPTLTYPLCSGPGFSWELGIDAALSEPK